MTQIRIDTQTQKRLHSVQEPVELVDDSGKVLGLFTPILRPPYDESLIPPMSQEDFERAVAEGEGISTDELLAQLESL